MANPNKTKLDASQCTVNTYDGVEESQRVSIVNSVEYAIELDAEDGDSVLAYNETTPSNYEFTVAAKTPAPNGTPVVSNEIAAFRFSQCVVYTNATGITAPTGYVILQASCSDTDPNMWHDITGRIYPGKIPPAELTSANTEAETYQGASSPIDICARRIRLYVPYNGRPDQGSPSVVYSIILRT